MENVNVSLYVGLVLIYALTVIVLYYNVQKYKKKYNDAITHTGDELFKRGDILYKYFEFHKDYAVYMTEPNFKSLSTSYKNGMLIDVKLVQFVDDRIRKL